MSYETDNTIILAVLRTLRESIPIDYTSVDGIDLSSSRNGTLFYETKRNSVHWAQVYALGVALNHAPDLTAGTAGFDPNWYNLLIGEKTKPQHVLTSSSPLDCFKTVSEAFCSEPGNGTLTCDLGFMSKYATKTGSIAYGGSIVLDATTKEVVSASGEPPHSASFDRELNRFLSSFAVHLVVERHATPVHLAISQRILMKVTRPAYSDVYGSCPAIKALVEFLTTRVNEVSLNEQLLIDNYNSLVSRAASFTNASLLEFCTDRYALYAQMSVEALVAQLLPGTSAFSVAGRRVHAAAQALASSICRGHLATDVTLDLGLMLWNSTFYHYFVGDYQVNNLIYGHLPLACTGYAHVQNQAYATLATTIAATTMTRTRTVQEIVSTLTDDQGLEHWQKYLRVMDGVGEGEVLPQFSLSPAYAAVNF